jgi:hypothetical protein
MTTADPVVLIADLFPGTVLSTETGERAGGLPGKGTKLHVIVSTTTIAVGWEAGVVEGVRQIGSVMLDISGMDISGLDHNGGIVGPYEVKRAGGCSCGTTLKRWNPWTGRQLVQLARPARPSTYGLPQRYTRSSR